MLAADSAVTADYTSAADANSEQLTAWPGVRCSFAVDCRAARAIAEGTNIAGTATFLPAILFGGAECFRFERQC